MVIDLLVIAAVVALAVYTAYRTLLAPKLITLRRATEQAAAIAAKAARDAAVTREHTENKHASAEHPNLRDDLDAKQAVTEGKLDSLSESVTALSTQLEAQVRNTENLSKLVTSVLNGQTRQDKELARVNDTLLADRSAQQATAEAQRETAAALAAHERAKAAIPARLDALESAQEELRAQVASHRAATEE